MVRFLPKRGFGKSPVKKAGTSAGASSKKGKKTQKTEIQAMDAEALRAHRLVLRQETLDLRFRKAAGELENSARLRQLRRDFARVKTRLVMLARQKLARQKEERT